MTLTEACEILLDSHTMDWRKEENFTILLPRYAGCISQQNYLDAWGVIRDYVVRARSSAGEQADHTRQVGGSNPPAPTAECPGWTPFTHPREIEWRCPACGRIRGEGCGRDNNENRIGCYLLGGPPRQENER